jgi:hypothetical protein
MATFLFWNLCKKNLTNDLVILCHENKVDVIILAESEGIEKTVLLEAVNQGQLTKFFNPSNHLSGLSFFFKYPANWIKNITNDSKENSHIAIREISLPTGLNILLVALHLSSKLHMDQYAQISQATRIIQKIEEAEEQVDHTNTLVIGDFNMNPFETGLVGADSFHAVMDRQTAKEYSRKVDNQNRRYFYNPMWGRMGDTSVGPPGTYYYRGGYLSYFWNTFDQVLLRPDLIDYFANDQLHVIDKIGQKSLLTQSGRGRIDKKTSSDHLPIMIALKEDNLP